MQKELEHIFVPYAIAELAKSKGYQKWCAGFQETATDNPQPNTIFAQWRFEQTPKRPIGLPTHYQLMIWLVRQFEIEVILNINGSFSVRDPTGRFIYQHDENQFDINTALVLALGIVG